MTAHRFDPAPPRPPPQPDPAPALQKAEAAARAAFERGMTLRDDGDLGGALHWLDYAHRQVPADANVRFALASCLLRMQAWERASLLFGAMAAEFSVRECDAGLAAAHLGAGRLDAARGTLAGALRCFSTDSALAGLAGRMGVAWCGVTADGVLLTSRAPAQLIIRLDGVPIQPPASACAYAPFASRLPRRWAASCMLSVEPDEDALEGTILGSPVDLGRLNRLEGFCARRTGGISGWAWYPAAPEREPVITLAITREDGQSVRRRLTARALDVATSGATPLARPRGFAAAVGAKSAVRVLSAGGVPLLGSPLLPVRPDWRRRLTPRAKIRPAAEPDLAVDVIIPVYRGVAATDACLRSVIGTVASPGRIIVVDDATPEPDLRAMLERRAASGDIVLIKSHADGGNHGFPAAVNAGLRAAAGHHVVLLNNDTLVAPGWLARLRAAANSADDIGTATPLSNEASIFSFPDKAGGNPAPDLAGTLALDRLAARANRGVLAEVPTANGFCMFIRRDCLAATGPFEERLFAQGYGEENDFTERARAVGFRHVAVPGVFVAHQGGVSFGAARHDLLRRNVALLADRHPAYLARVRAAAADDTLFFARRRLELAQFLAAAADRPAVLLVSHVGGGGTARIVAERAAAIEAAGKRAIVLRPRDGFCTLGDGAAASANLRFVLPVEKAALLKVLRAMRPGAVEIHHLKGHHPALLEIIASLAVPYDVWVHDYGWFCARLCFVTAQGQFCGEPESSACETCIGTGGRLDEDSLPPAALRARSARLMLTARAVIVPSRDVAHRVRRYAPGVVAHIAPWEALPRPAPARVLAGTQGVVTVAVIGAISQAKGYDVLRACARDAAARGLPLRFVLVGYSSGDDALLAQGVRITGEFSRAEAVDMIRAQGAQLAFLPSVWPETWCYALSDAWAAGLSAAVFDIGTPALRVRACGRGWRLPLALPAWGVNDALLALVEEKNVLF